MGMTRNRLSRLRTGLALVALASLTAPAAAQEQRSGSVTLSAEGSVVLQALPVATADFLPARRVIDLCSIDPSGPSCPRIETEPIGLDLDGTLDHPLAHCLGEPPVRDFPTRYLFVDRLGRRDFQPGVMEPGVVEPGFFDELDAPNPQLFAPIGRLPGEPGNEIRDRPIDDFEELWLRLEELVTGSCREGGAEPDLSDSSCFDERNPYAADSCSFDAPQLCPGYEELVASCGVEEMGIDVRPARRRNVMRLRPRGCKRFFVSVYMPEGMVADDLDPESLLLGDPGLEGAAAPTHVRQTHPKRQHRGGPEWIARFCTRDLMEAGAVDEDSTQLELTGATRAGGPLAGRDDVETRSRR